MCIILANQVKDPKIALIGDSHQTIYGYNGSDSRFLSLADRLFKSSGINFCEWACMKLTVSHRLSRNVINLLMLLNKNITIVSKKQANQKIRYIVCNTFSSRPLNEVLYYISKGYSYSDILILAPSTKCLKKLINDLSDRGLPIYCGQHESGFYSESKIVCCTFHQAKGLERKVVIILNFDSSYYKYFNKISSGQECSNELYVAITRSSDQLSLIHHYQQFSWSIFL